MTRHRQPLDPPFRQPATRRFQTQGRAVQIRPHIWGVVRLGTSADGTWRAPAIYLLIVEEEEEEMKRWKGQKLSYMLDCLETQQHFQL